MKRSRMRHRSHSQLPRARGAGQRQRDGAAVLLHAKARHAHVGDGDHGAALALADDETSSLWDNLALGYTESAGHPLLRQEIARKPDPTVELQLHYARLLLALDQQVEFEAQVDQLARRSYLSPAERGDAPGS